MNKIEDKIFNKKNIQQILLENLSKLGDVNEDDIKKLQNDFDEKFLPLFEKFSQEKKMILAFLHKLPQEELQELYNLINNKNDKTLKYIVGFHEFKSSLDTLLITTKNPKYNFLNNSKENS